MKIDWAALGIVAVVSIGMAVLFTVLLSAGIRSVSAARTAAQPGRQRHRGARRRLGRCSGWRGCSSSSGSG